MEETIEPKPIRSTKYIWTDELSDLLDALGKLAKANRYPTEKMLRRVHLALDNSCVLFEGDKPCGPSE